jgi:ABC-type amino acid transport substrate-binding protein
MARWRVEMATAALLVLAVLAGCAGPTGSNAGGAPAAGQLTATPGIVRAGICPLRRTRLLLRPKQIEAFQDELLRRLGYKLALRMQVSTLPSCSEPAAALGDQTVDLLATAPGPDLASHDGVLQTEPYLVVQYALVVAAGSTSGQDGLGSLGSGARIGVLAGTRGESWARGRFARRGATVVPFVDGRAAAAAITGGNYHAAILPRADAVRVAKAVPGVRIDRLLDVGERATFQVAADNPDLRARVDRMLEEIVFDGSYAVIFHRHLAPTPVPVDFLPPD